MRNFAKDMAEARSAARDRRNRGQQSGNHGMRALTKRELAETDPTGFDLIQAKIDAWRREVDSYYRNGCFGKPIADDVEIPF